MLKAFLRDRSVQNPVQVSADGTSLVPYPGNLSMFDELDKLASNIGMARLFGGVHWRSDHENGLLLGELIALRVLQDITRLYHENFNGYSVRTFDGNNIYITKNGPTLPNHVSAITRFTLINTDTDQPVTGFDPLLNGKTLDRSELPPNLTIRAHTFPDAVGSVRFNLDGSDVSTANTAPYALAGAPNQNYQPSPLLIPGVHVLKATPYSGSNATVLAGVPLTIRFTVVS